MKPLIVLLSAWTLTLIIYKFVHGTWLYARSGRIAMSVMLIFTALGHFLYPEGMAMMLPDFVPFKQAIIASTGILEIAAAVGILVPRWRWTTAWLLIGFFILILPANIYAAAHNIDYQTGSFEGPGLAYLWFRIPLQILFIVWTYLCCLKN